MDENFLIYVPYSNHESEPEILNCVELNIQVLGFTPKLVKMQHNYSYGEFINDLWDKGHPFVIVEHDCFPYPGAIQDILQCPEPICAFGGTLQCAKITPISEESPLPSKTTWMHCDAILFSKYPPHMHLPEVANVNRANIPR